ncbi:DNA mismatch repair protein MutS [Anaerovorax odorimutans]|uniref:DNA mismatch repair protein MutS n=1 Tax=Anaerovorax odorimutans TaxID=109327 RepID=A0ABT1RL31_9FIRM|nr:DNA mismatch repair protein MutS [Anaerovorax odorimutans]MCQ4635877.1 DNA mismatch repair protein MutS [Anaerovorax odorimutans]
MALSPMMQQYIKIKEEYQDCILFFRLGDFYEMFFEDAKTASRELELTLTGKNCGQEERAPMCGVPFHSADTYIARLVEKGYKVAICEQTEDPSQAKGIVKREVIRIVTPGTVISQTMLKETENNYIASVFSTEGKTGFAYCDVSTGEIYATELPLENSFETLLNELVKIKAREILINEDHSLDMDEMKQTAEAYFNPLGGDYYNDRAVTDAVLRQFKVKALLGLGLEEGTAAVRALGAMLLYLHETQKNSLEHISWLHLYKMGTHMALDKATIKNLELTETLFEKKIQGSLLGVLDKTSTAMGSRRLKQWLKEPLNNARDINMRLEAVEVLTDDLLMRNNIRESLKQIYDFERLSGRIACGSANGKDLIALRNSCFVLPDIKSDLSGTDSLLLKELEQEIDDLKPVYDLIDRAIVEEPPFAIKEGGIIKEGYSKELDELKFSIKDAQNWIAQLESAERERTGIKNLKVGFNKVFGYYLEITKSYYDMIPENYVRKQTLANCERFITPELKEMESLVLNAEVKINQMEYDLFTQVRSEIQGYIRQIQKTSAAVSGLDVLTSFALVGQQNNYVRPVVDESDTIEIEKGRHPVIEQTIRDGIFVSNDIYLDRNKDSLLLITGPNMAGKSTYMRQTALIVLMAQSGCFVPAESARIGLVDRIFTRIGASDNLAQGQSTFFVEMSELAYILNSATEKSLIILDEIGRGTSTYDGLSIAWAAAEYLCRTKNQVRTLFATHYHEMTTLEGHMKGLKNLNVDVAEENGNVVFLHKIVEGSASRSYGIQVAKLAGVPSLLLERAADKLKELEEGRPASELAPYDEPALLAEEEQQISFFGFAPNPVVERLKALDLMNLTPSEAFKILEELKEAAKG